MSKDRDEWVAREAAREIVERRRSEMFREAVENPTKNATSELIAILCGLVVSTAFHEDDHIVEGTGVMRNHAVDVISAEIDRRIPVPKEGS